MNISKELQKFIEDNINLIEQNTKESWNTIYSMDPPEGLAEMFITRMDIDPARIMEYIPDNYLYNSTIENYTIPDNVMSIGHEAFFLCRSLISIEIPDSVTSIGDKAFSYCSSLTKLDYTGTIDQWVQIEFADSDSNPLYYAEKLHINNELVTEAVITTATKINDYAFYWCSSLTRVEIGDSVTSIGYQAFCKCKSLTNITIPNSITSIGDNAFDGCSSLTEINFKGTKKEAHTILEVKNKGWRRLSSIQKINCIDGVIDL